MCSFQGPRLWARAGSREELAERMGAAVEDIPGMAASFSQPKARPSAGTIHATSRSR
jgi:hypothetical protein